MQLTMNQAIWAVFNDICIMAVLLLIGQFLRAKIKIFQKLLIPSALIAGGIALVLGPKGYGILKLSPNFGTYAAVLIVVIFAATPIGDKPSKEAMSGPVIGGMFFNITGIAVLQYAIGMLVTVYGLRFIYPNLPEQFGLMMATGFYGGHGTAIAVGNALESMGVPNMTDFGNTCATIGIVGGIISGVGIINWGTRKGYTHYVDSPQNLPIELRTGLIPPEKQKAAGKVSISSICLDPLSFHIALVLLASVGGILISDYFKSFSAGLGYAVSIPAFCTALLCGFLINKILNRTKAHSYVDRYSISRIQGVATDFLMVSGIGSLNLSVVLDYLGPLLIVCGIGFLITWWWFIYIGGKSSREDWFERNMMCWGHATGVAATGVLLQRVVDPDLKSRGIEDSGIADLFNRPLIVGLQVIPPIVMNILPNFGAHIVTWGIFMIVLVMWIIAWKLKWWIPSQKRKIYRS
ncbi:sodium:glutamate symporter [Fusobacterium necrophorum subsp. funduliforme]|uniref:Sodium:glutamate symporter n=3 Tax=Fusobacterium necrophorum TaxID=859 RepID=A0A017H5Y0_9FUSO|nr:sodium/glutamate symporter [Fusobacterium necrophorum]AYZ72890.1 sodium:glutamate symporter [Fusobacterium necrophorum]AZW09110.1 sodium:glutamate symporter [Fusobacterium necrophorum subsp. necrophorum]EYD69705.1 sodium/glutamate symporter [Fusobacterium necrophorum subsp. funduliforme B35]KDE67167.1 sodium:glutamate symporter [Fusobacterium necrophorum DJ-1]KID48853.1 sodium:glutamate symporter [Fusobacterium necrophorum subsp. funduliforme B35]